MQNTLWTGLAIFLPDFCVCITPVFLSLRLFNTLVLCVPLTVSSCFEVPRPPVTRSALSADPTRLAPPSARLVLLFSALFMQRATSKEKEVTSYHTEQSTRTKDAAYVRVPNSLRESIHMFLRTRRSIS
jgi:hypothetical protein